MYKMTLVSVRVRGRQLSLFVSGEVGKDGKVRVPNAVIDGMLSAMGLRYGETWSMG